MLWHIIESEAEQLFVVLDGVHVKLNLSAVAPVNLDAEINAKFGSSQLITDIIAPCLPVCNS